MKTNVITKEVMVERINNRFEQVFMNELPYKNDIQLFNTSKMLFNWFIDYKFNNQLIDLIKSIYNLSKVDFLDLISSVALKTASSISSSTETNLPLLVDMDPSGNVMNS